MGAHTTLCAVFSLAHPLVTLIGDVMGYNFNPENPADVKRLRDAVNNSRKKLAPFRKKRKEFITEYVGHHYGEEPTKDKRPVNMVQLAVNVWRRQLAVRAPNVLARPAVRDMADAAEEFELAINENLNLIGFGDTLYEWTTNAFFGLSPLKIGLDSVGEIEIDGEFIPAGEPFAEVVSQDDWVHDCSVNRKDDFDFCGHQYRMPLDQAREKKEFNKKGRNRLKEESDPKRQEDGESKASSISHGRSNAHGDETLCKYTTLWDLWLPKDGLIVTIGASNLGDVTENDVLQVQKWTGPNHGPYHLLAFGYVPDQVMPSAPVSTICDLNESANRLTNKSVRMAERQKTFLGFRDGGDEDAERAKGAQDGDVVRMQDPEKVKSFATAGPDQGILGLAMMLQSKASYFAGNLDTLGGLSPQADTVGQEKLLQDASSELVKDWQDQMYHATKRVVSDLAGYVWDDPIRSVPIRREIGGFETQYDWPYAGDTTPGMPDDLRAGSFTDYQIDIEPHSMTPQSPREQQAAIDEIVQTVVIPMMPMWAEEGIAFDWHEYLRTKAKNLNIPELAQFILYQEAKALSGGGQGRQSPVTTRHNVRTNRPGATRQGQDEAMAQMMFGNNQQPSQAASLVREVG